MNYYLEKLEQIKNDKYQYEAYETNESSVIIAGPGSGKTTILTLKIMKLLRTKIKEPIGLACITYSKEAAREFKDKLDLMGFTKRKNVFLGTVHSFCINEILNNYGKLYNLGITFPIRIISQNEKKNIFEKSVKKLGYDKKEYKITEMDKVRNISIKGKSRVSINIDTELLKIANEYENELLKSKYLDYESIIKFSIRLIKEKEYVRKCLNAKFKWILIDEYQDLGKPLHEMILQIFENTNIKIFAVGDPDQSIYSFSGAYPNYLLELYEKDNIKKIKLINNYRSNQDIIDGSEEVLNIKRNYNAANRINEKAKYFFVTCKEDLLAQYEYVVDKIIPYYMKQGIPAEEIAILVSKNNNAKELAYLCKKNNIPYYISKHNFERSDIVKWLEDIALWLTHKKGADFDEIYNFYEKLLIEKNKRKYLINSESLKLRKELYNILEQSNKFKENLKKWLEFLIIELNIYVLLRGSNLYPDEIDNIEKLFDELEEDIYKNYTIEEFSQIGKPQNQVTISTRHSCKGLEFEIIIMLGMEEGNFPDFRKVSNDEQLEEENRMCFVCISRAKSVCILMRSKINNITCKNGTIWSKEMKPSRYWNQLYNKFK